MRIEIERGLSPGQDMSHIGLSFAEITDLLETYQRIGYFRQDIEAGLAFFSADACRIFGVDVTKGPVSLTDIVRKLHPEDVELLTSTFETSARLKTGFDLACRVLKDAGGEKFIRMVGKFRPGASGEGEVAGLVYEFFERMQIVDFGHA